MSGEKKFRAWDKKNKEMISPVGIGTFGEPLNEYNEMMDNCELMQYTGLKDKNGKEICEGHIVKVKWGGVGYVVFQDGSFISRWEDGKVEYRVCKSDIESRELEVIGNIYENPELLEVSE